MKRMILLFLCLLLLTGCGGEKTWHLVEEHWDVDGQIQEVFYEYDGEWKLISQIIHNVGGGNRTEYAYDDQGELIREQLFVGANLVYDFQYTTTRDEAGRVIRREKTRDGQVTETEELIYDGEELQERKFVSYLPDRTEITTEEFEEGLLVRRNRETKIGDKTAVSTVEYTYQNGLLVEEVCDLYRKVCIYQDGQLIRQESFYGETWCWWEYTYEDDTCICVQYDGDGTMVDRTICSYDQAGNLICEEYYDGAGELWQRTSYKYIVG